MHDILDIHEALPDERMQAYRNMHEAWSRGMSLDDFSAWRLVTPAHNFARWFVGTLGKKVVTSLACYPLEFCWQGDIIPGIGIGAVYTIPDQRRHGHAASLVREVLTRAKSESAKVAMLFSDIAPAYYEAFGFVRWPSLTFHYRISKDSPTVSGESHLTLHPVDPLEQLKVLAELYQGGHADMEVWLSRNSEYWTFAIGRYPDAKFYFVRDTQGRVGGYVRLQQKETRLDIGEMAVDRSIVHHDEALLPALVQRGRELGATTLSGWLPTTSTLSCHFEAESRSQEITMLVSLSSHIRFSERLVRNSHFWSADHF